MFFVHSLFQVYAVALQQTAQTIKEPKTTREKKQQKPKKQFKQMFVKILKITSNYSIIISLHT